MRRELFAVLCPALLLLSGCVSVATDSNYDTKAQTNREMKTYDENSWESSRALLRAAEASGNYALVVKVADEALMKNPTNVEARVRLARAHTKLGDPEQALRVLNFVSVSTPELELERARALLKLNDADGAQNALSKTLRDPAALPLDVRRDAMGLKAVAEALQGRLAAAEEIYKTLLSEKDDPVVRFNYGRTLLFADRPEEAFKQLRPLVGVIDAARPAAAAALISLGRVDEAKALLRDHLDAQEVDKLVEAQKSR